MTKIFKPSRIPVLRRRTVRKISVGNKPVVSKHQINFANEKIPVKTNRTLDTLIDRLRCDDWPKELMLMITPASSHDKHFKLHVLNRQNASHYGMTTITQQELTDLESTAAFRNFTLVFCNRFIDLKTVVLHPNLVTNLMCTLSGTCCGEKRLPTNVPRSSPVKAAKSKKSRFIKQETVVPPRKQKRHDVYLKQFERQNLLIKQKQEEEARKRKEKQKLDDIQKLNEQNLKQKKSNPKILNKAKVQKSKFSQPLPTLQVKQSQTVCEQPPVSPTPTKLQQLNEESKCSKVRKLPVRLPIVPPLNIPSPTTCSSIRTEEVLRHFGREELQMSKVLELEQKLPVVQKLSCCEPAKVASSLNLAAVIGRINSTVDPDKYDLMRFFDYAEKHQFRIYARPELTRNIPELVTTRGGRTEIIVRFHIDCFMVFDIYVGCIMLNSAQFERQLAMHPSLLPRVKVIDEVWDIVPLPWFLMFVLRILRIVGLVDIYDKIGEYCFKKYQRYA